MDDSPRNTQARAIATIVREFEVDGVRWTVREFPPPSYDRRGRPSLMFASDEIMRRVRTYPANWADLSDAELLAVSGNC
jgi:hypothetical protein